MNSRGVVDKVLIGAVIVVLVIVVVGGLLYKLDLLGKLKIVLPSFGDDNRDSDGSDGDNTEAVINSVYFDEDGRCKPVKGLYSLKDRRLEVWSGSDWVSFEDRLPKGEDLLFLEMDIKNIKGSLEDYWALFKHKEFYLEVDSVKYPISFTNTLPLFVSNINGVNYLYGEEDLIFEDSDNSVNSIYESGNYVGEMEDKEKNEKIFNAFKEFYSNLKISYGGKDYKLEYDSSIAALFFELNGIKYGVDNKGASYVFLSSLSNDWIKEKNEITEFQKELYLTKLDLIEKCG